MWLETSASAPLTGQTIALLYSGGRVGRVMISNSDQIVCEPERGSSVLSLFS